MNAIVKASAEYAIITGSMTLAVVASTTYVIPYVMHLIYCNAYWMIGWRNRKTCNQGWGRCTCKHCRLWCIVWLCQLLASSLQRRLLCLYPISSAGEIILSSCSLSISRIVAAAVEVIDYEYWFLGRSAAEVGGHHDEGGGAVGFRHHESGWWCGFALQRPRLIAVYEVRVLERRAVVQKILCKKRTLFIFYFPSLFNNSTMMAAQIRWCSRGCILDQITWLVHQ